MVRDLEQILRSALEEVLEELTGADRGTCVTYSLSMITRLTREEDEEDGLPEGHAAFYHQDFWRIGMFVTLGNQYMNLISMLPVELVQDGDVQPLVCQIRSMWSEREFGMLLLDDNLDSELERIAAEHHSNGGG